MHTVTNGDEANPRVSYIKKESRQENQPGLDRTFMTFQKTWIPLDRPLLSAGSIPAKQPLSPQKKQLPYILTSGVEIRFHCPVFCPVRRSTQ